MLDITAATEGEIDGNATIASSKPDRAVRDDFEDIWRIAGLPPNDLGRNPDGTYKAPHATRAWDTYAITRDWHVVLTAARRRM
jgi:hypothetical protein